VRCPLHRPREVLLDQNLSTPLAALLINAGHDVVHTSQLGLSRADDLTVLDRAAAETGSWCRLTRPSASFWPRPIVAGPR